jgi:glutamine synthetase
MAEGQSLTVEGLRHAVEAGEIDTVTVCTPDLFGKLMGKQVPAASFVANLPRGVEISCSIYVYDDEQNVNEGFPEIGEQNGWADMAAVPDLDTLRRAAHLDRSAIVLADVWWSPGRAVEISPRAVLRRQVERAHAAGLVPHAAVEYEFHVLAESFESARAKGYRGLEQLHTTLADYSISRQHRDEPLTGAIWRSLAASGIPVDTIKTEMGHGQLEITFEPADGLEAADRAALAKLFIRQIAAQRGLAATFMARLSHLEMGSSGHVHVSVADAEGGNRFDPDGHALSELGQRFVGGLMRRAPEFMVLACPYVNSYKRLDPSNFVTPSLDFAADARTVPFRVCGHGPSRNVEYRIPGADGNPYLILAAMLAAGLDGVEQGAAPFRAGSAEAERVGDLPSTLAASVDRWSGSEWARATFGDLVVDTIAVAARHEVAVHEREVSDVELRRGFELA